MPKLVNTTVKFCGDLIEIRRKVLGLSLGSIAKSLKVTTPAVSNWANGKFAPQAKHIPSLAKILKMKPENFFLKQNAQLPVTN